MLDCRLSARLRVKGAKGAASTACDWKLRFARRSTELEHYVVFADSDNLTKMARHSKNATSAPFYSYHERKKIKGLTPTLRKTWF